MFKGVCYVGTDKGLLVSKDKGATWEAQGSPIDVIQGPHFGADENSMVITNTTGMYKSTDAGETWKFLSALVPRIGWQYPIDEVFCFGGYVWDPINNVCYAAAIGYQAYKKVLDIIPPTAPTGLESTNITSTGFTVKWAAATDDIRVTGYEVFNGDESCGTTTSNLRWLKITGLTPETTYTITVKTIDVGGNLSEASEPIEITTLPEIGVDNTAASEVAIYPNPTVESITIEVAENAAGSVVIYNAAGAIVAEKTIETNNTKIDVSAFPKGTYLAKITSGRECVTKSFIVE